MTETEPSAWLAAYDEVMGLLRDRERDLAASVREWIVNDAGDGKALLNGVFAAASGQKTMSGSLIISGDNVDALRVVMDGLPPLPPPLLGRFVAVVLASDVFSGFGSNGAGRSTLYTFLRVVKYAYGQEAHAGQEIPFDVSFLERLCVAVGLPTSHLMTAAHEAFQSRGSYDEEAMLPRFRGYADYVRRHADVLRELLARPGVSDRLAALDLLSPLPADVLGLFAEGLALAATSGAVKVRATAEPLLGRCGGTPEQVRAIALNGKLDARLCALRLLWTDGDAEQRAWCQQRAADDKAGRVRILAEEWSSLATAVPEPEPLALDRPVFDWHEIVSAEDRAILQGIVDVINGRHPGVDSLPIPPLAIDQMVAALETGHPNDLPAPRGEHSKLYWVGQQGEVKPKLGLAGTAALLHLCGVLAERHGSGMDDRAISLLDRFYADTGHPTLAEMAAMLDDLGYAGPKSVLFSWGNDSEWRDTLAERPDEEVAEFTRLHLDVVLDQVAPVEREYGLHKRAAHRALATLPSLPARAVDHLYAVALGSRKVERRAAQDLLNRVPGIGQRIVPTLGDSRTELRGEAAAWLSRIADPTALEPLERAFAKEKQDVPLAAMLDALQALGQPVEKYLRPSGLTEQARKAVAKGLPKELAWFPWDGLPRVRWAAGGVVPVEVLQWFMSQAVKAKSPEPNALLRTYTSMFEPRDREELGQFVLEAWVAEDVRPFEPARARQNAEAEAHLLHYYYAHHAQDHPFHGLTEEQLTEALLPRHLRAPAGSATTSKGVLAVAAVCAGERAAPVVQRYLKRFLALRRTQGQSLVAMLAWIDHPGATQVMLSVSSRFRSKSIQAEATRQVEALAARKGWSVAELTDRSVPVAGLDDDGVLELSYGERSFIARLLPDLTLELRSPEDKVLKTLPAGRVSDDEAAVKDAKKAYSATKRELKELLGLQTARLYEALCTQRTWQYAVWHRYVLGHPVLRHLAARLVWQVTHPDGSVLVRPLGDGTLTDVHDGPVNPVDDATVGVAHESLVAPEVAAAWLTHLADYEVTPLFVQFGKEVFTLAEGQADETALSEFEGTMMESLALGSHANALGYHRGDVGDAAVFDTYEKSYSSLGLVAVINFSGSAIDEQSGKVALTTLTFERTAAPRMRRRAVTLGDVPAVLLSEAWQDMRTVAAHGSGQDPQWQTKVHL